MNTTRNLTNPLTGKTYTFKGFTPISRIMSHCKDAEHSKCEGKPQDMVAMFDFDFAKKICCLCACHFTREAI